MNFWIIAVVLLTVSAAVISWPLFAGSAKDRITGVLILLMIPLVGVVSYQYIGTPEAISLDAPPPQQAAQSQQPHSSTGDNVDVLVAELQQRMAENPEDPEGWLILGRTLKTMQRYPEALEALTNAHRLIPGTPIIMIELAEAKLYASGTPEITTEIRQLIESALEIDPTQQKGLWLLGMAAAEDGDYALAIDTWQKLLGELDPASESAARVTRQIEMAQANLGPTPTEVAETEVVRDKVTEAEVAIVEAPVATTTVAESGIPVTITVGDELASSVPANAALFIFIHPAGGSGMPLAVKRVAARGFPMSLNFSDADLLRPGTSLQDFEQLDISARISIGGIANAASGDIQATKTTLNTKAVKPIALHLDQRVP